MSEVRPTYSDEFDLFELFETLWDGKWLISAFVAFATLIGFVYSQTAQPRYDVSVPFNVNVYSVFSQQICETSDCLDEGTSGIFLEAMGSGWTSSIGGEVIRFTTLSPASRNDYEDMLSNALISTNQALETEAVAELATIESISNSNLLTSERVATNFLNALRAIQSIESGQNAITFGSVQIVKSSPKVRLILALSVLIGVMIGSFLVFIRNAVKKRKEQLANV